ncbi:MAG: superinfection immunity protein [Dehalococcoidia bacterium]|nr:superinfection immunity protein [Dehalococcoidia bacterium]
MNSGFWGLFVVIILVFCVIYFFPSILALAVNHHNFTTIFIINILLGWCFIGWIAALIMAFLPRNKAPGKPLEIAQRRFASGEIDMTTYETLKQTLQKS